MLDNGDTQFGWASSKTAFATIATTTAKDSNFILSGFLALGLAPDGRSLAEMSVEPYKD